MTGYRCESGACPQITYDGDTVTIIENTNPEQVVVTSAAKWDAYLDTVRAQERAAIVAMLRERAAAYDAEFARPGEATETASSYRRAADLIERGDDLAAGDE